MIGEKVCHVCGEPYEGSLREHLTKTCKPVEVKMEELIRLTNSRVRELETRLVETEEGLKTLREIYSIVESERLRLSICLRAALELAKEWRKRNLHHCNYCADELEAALRGEAEDYVMLEREEAEDQHG